jgi:hypothetical protein
MRAGDDMPRGERRSRRREHRPRGRVILIVVAVALFILVTTLRSVASFYTDYLWFNSIGQTGVWRGVLGTKIGLAVVFIGLFFALMWVNLLIADRLAPRFRPAGPEEELIERYHEIIGQRQGALRIGIAALFAVIAGAGAAGEWNEYLLFRNYVSFGVKDPQFHKDIGFYVFQLPFLGWIVGWLFAAFVIVFIVTAVAHYLNGGIRVQTPFQRVTPQVKAHLSVLLAVLALVKAGGYYLQQFSLATSTRGTVDGPTYTDVHAQLPAIRLLLVISLFSVALFLYNIFRRGWVLPVLGVGLWAFVAVVAGTIVPAFIQKFRVEPSESSKERTYIERNIDATRAAMNLHSVDVKDFANDNQLNTQSLLDNKTTVQNIRIWDPAANISLKTFQQLQALKPFYKIDDVDVDRYTINGQLTQVLLSSRELNTGGVPQTSWEGTHLAFTHGYGLVLAPSNGQTPEGQPDFQVQDIPLSNTTDIPVDQPDIYFGEHLDGYVVVNTKRPEIDYQDANGNNVSTTYSGKDGIDMSSWIRRAAFALRFGDYNALVSGNITPSSRIIINRDIYARVTAIAPFLVVDGGHVKWVIDGYTTTDRYPYAQRAITDGGGGLSGRFNYVRNSVKAVIDAYDGTTTLYVVDHSDPIVRAYQKAFPSLFSSTDAPADLAEHFRYPEDMFRVQTNMWGRYHLDNPDAFYTNANAWAVAPDPGTQTQTGVTATTTPNDNQVPESPTGRIPPYYVLLSLPGETDQGFMLFRPFVPVQSGNQQMTAFMIAKSDPGHYGQLETFQMPSNNLPPSPTLVANTMTSDPTVAGLQTLLGVRGGGSEVVFGNLIILPIEKSLLYIRPVYVQATGDNNPPLLRKVIVEYKGQVQVSDTLPQALQLFPDFADLPVANPQQPQQPQQPSQQQPQQPTESSSQLLQEALDAFDAANAALAKNPPDYTTYGQQLQLAQQKIAQAQTQLSAPTTTAPASSSSSSSSAPPSSSSTPESTTTTTTAAAGGSALAPVGPP